MSSTRLAGDLTWQVMRKDQDSDGHQKTLYQIAAKEFSDDKNDKTVRSSKSVPMATVTRLS
jgi:hypothetical protein